MSRRMTKEELKEYFTKLSNFQFDEIIEDKERAMAILCETTKAWDYISPRLKKDPDVMMCYQPIGKASLDYYTYIEGKIYTVGPDIYIEEGFEYKNIGSCTKILVPVWAKDVKRFDYRRYWEIQETLKRESWYIGIDRDKLDFPNPFTKAIKKCDEKSEMWPCAEVDVTLYDRELLRRLLNVPELGKVKEKSDK